jgi:hypothetical protein
MISRGRFNNSITRRLINSFSKQQFIDTYQVILQLEKSGFKRVEAVEIIRSFNIILQQKLSQVRENNVTREEAESAKNEYKVALQQLKTEVSTLRKTESANLQSTTSTTQRELNMISLKFREDFNQLKSDLQVSFWNLTSSRST